MKLNISKFKKISETPHIAILQHPMGHRITIAKSALSPKLKKDLSMLPKHMADGGDSDDDQPMGQGYFDSDSDQGKDISTQDLQGALTSQDSSQQSSQQPSVSNYVLPQTQQSGTSPQAHAGEDYISQLRKGYGALQAGILGQSQAQQQMAKSEAQYAEDFQNDINKARQTHEQITQYIHDEQAKAMIDVQNGHIDPSHYINSKSDVGKVATGLGLILGGIGGGLTHGPNQALQFINNQIDRDVQAQQMELGKKENILSYFLKQGMAENEAYAMTRGFYTDLYTTRLKQAAAQAGTPMAQAIAQQVSGNLQLQKANQIAPLAMRQAILANTQSGQIDPSVAVRFLVDPKDQSTAYKEVANMQEMNSLRKDILQSFDQVHGMWMSGLMSPNDREAAKQSFIPKLTQLLEHRYNHESAQNIADSFFPKTAQLLHPSLPDTENTILNKRERLNQIMDTMIQTPTLDAYNIPTQKVHPNPRPVQVRGYGQR